MRQYLFRCRSCAPECCCCGASSTAVLLLEASLYATSALPTEASAAAAGPNEAPAALCAAGLLLCCLLSVTSKVLLLLLPTWAAASGRSTSWDRAAWKPCAAISRRVSSSIVLSNRSSDTCTCCNAAAAVRLGQDGRSMNLRGCGRNVRRLQWQRRGAPYLRVSPVQFLLQCRDALFQLFLHLLSSNRIQSGNHLHCTW